MLGAHAVELGPAGMLAINIAILTLVGWALMRAERGLADGREWTLLALLALFGIAGRVLLEPLPNIQPVTALVLIVGIRLGAMRGVALAGAIALGSNLLMGHGIWTLYQAFAWSAVACIGALASSRLNSVNRIAIAAFACGFVFDWLVSLSILHAVSITALPAYLIAGLPYDLLHGIGNMAFVAWLATPLLEMIERHDSITVEVEEGVTVTA